MTKREIPLPVALVVIAVVVLVAVFVLFRKTSPPTESRLQRWAPYPTIPANPNPQNR